MAPRCRGLVPLLAMLVAVTGCVAPRPLGGTPGEAPATRTVGSVDFYDGLPGNGTVAVQLSDLRRSAQGLANAASDTTFDALVFRLSNGSKLRQALVRVVPRNADDSPSYPAVFANLPVDAAPHYFLTVSLYRGIADPSDPLDPGFTHPQNKVGEGVSSGFAVSLGATTSVSLAINAVGSLVLGSDDVGLDRANPVYATGTTRAWVDSGVAPATDPLVDQLVVSVFPTSSTATLSTTPCASSSWSPRGTATASFPVPASVGTYQITVDALDAAGALLSSRSRPFLVDNPGAPAVLNLKVTSISPTGGAVGAAVNLYGTGFSPVLGENLVWIGRRAATVTLASSTSVRVTVPAWSNGGLISVARVGSTTIVANRFAITPYTVAGTLHPPAGIAATSWGLASIGLAADASGNLLLGDPFNYRVWRLSAAGALTTFLGDGIQGQNSYGDGGQAINARINGGGGVTWDATGSAYVTDYGVVRKISPAGVTSTVAGTGTPGYSGDGGQALSAMIQPSKLLVDASGSLFISEGSNHRIRRVATNGLITTFAGTGTAGFTGDGVAATSAGINNPSAMALDSAGNLYFSDSGNHRVRRIDPAGVITTVAGNGTAGFAGDGGAATSAKLNAPGGLTLDAAGNLYVADTSNNRIRKVAPGGTITTAVGTGTSGFTADGALATSTMVSGLCDLAIDGSGCLLYSDYNNKRIRRVNADGTVTSIAGNGATYWSGDAGPADRAQLQHPAGMTLDGAGNLFIADTRNQRVRKVAQDGTITTVAGNGTLGYSGDNGLATSAMIQNPSALTFDAAGNLYIADGNDRIRKVTPGGIISTVAGNGFGGYGGDGGLATNATMNTPSGVAVDGKGNLFFSCESDQRVRRVNLQGIVTTYAGVGSSGFSGDGAAATGAKLYNPRGIAVDPAGNLFIADYYNHRVRKVAPNGIISTVAGTGTAGTGGDGGVATSAQLSYPSDVALDGAGNLYVAQSLNGSVRRITPAGIISTVSGTSGGRNLAVDATTGGGYFNDWDHGLVKAF